MSGVLLVEDDPEIALAVQTVLAQGKLDVRTTENGRKAFRLFHDHNPELVILDIGLPGDLDGWDVLDRLRAISDVPVLILTARGLEADKVRGLEGGADDYLTKPFGNRELWARVQALLRRSPGGPETANVYDDGRIRMSLEAGELLVEDHRVDLTPMEFRLLGVLVENRGRILSPESILEAAWADPSAVGPERVKFAIMRLRRKIAAVWDGELGIEAVRGVGYRYVPPKH
jgi:DNA-binding response OmpR family regulator